MYFAFSFTDLLDMERNSGNITLREDLRGADDLCLILYVYAEGDFGYQSTSCKNWFPLFAMWLPGSNLAFQASMQVPLSTRTSHQPWNIILNIVLYQIVYIRFYIKAYILKP